MIAFRLFRILGLIMLPWALCLALVNHQAFLSLVSPLVTWLFLFSFVDTCLLYRYHHELHYKFPCQTYFISEKSFWQEWWKGGMFLELIIEIRLNAVLERRKDLSVKAVISVTKAGPQYDYLMYWLIRNNLTRANAILRSIAEQASAVDGKATKQEEPVKGRLSLGVSYRLLSLLRPAGNRFKGSGLTVEQQREQTARAEAARKALAEATRRDSFLEQARRYGVEAQVQLLLSVQPLDYVAIYRCLDNARLEYQRQEDLAQRRVQIERLHPAIRHGYDLPSLLDELARAHSGRDYRKAFHTLNRALRRAAEAEKRM